MKRLSSGVFVAVLAGFSAVLIVLSLFASIRLAALNDEAARVEQETASLVEDNKLLIAMYEMRVSIDELERVAVNELGMQRCAAGQIEYIDISKYTDMSEQTG